MFQIHFKSFEITVIHADHGHIITDMIKLGFDVEFQQHFEIEVIRQGGQVVTYCSVQVRSNEEQPTCDS